MYLNYGDWMRFKTVAFNKEELVIQKTFDTPQEAQRQADMWFKKMPYVNRVRIEKLNDGM
jgi:hypothetical protein